MLNTAYECLAKCSCVSRFKWLFLFYFRISNVLFFPLLLVCYCSAQYVRRLSTNGVGG